MRTIVILLSSLVATQAQLPQHISELPRTRTYATNGSDIILLNTNVSGGQQKSTTITVADFFSQASSINANFATLNATSLVSSRFVGDASGLTNRNVTVEKARIFNVKDYGAFGDGTNGSVTSVVGSTLVGNPATPFTLADQGKIISISKAGPAGLALTTTIATFVNATTVTLTVGASQSVGNTNNFVYGLHDDTAAIQAALNNVVTNGGGTIFFPQGVYIVNGTIQDPGPFWTRTNLNSQISCPPMGLSQFNLSTLLGNAPPWVTVKFQGAGPRNTIIWSTLSEGGGGNVIDFKNKINPYSTVASGNGGNIGQNLVMPMWDSISVRSMLDANITPINMEAAVNASMVDCNVNAGFDLGTTPPITNTRTNHAGVVWPCGGNYGLTDFDRVWVLGYWNGMTAGEHVNGKKVLIGDCYFAVTAGGFLSGGHIDRIWNLDVINCHRVFDKMGNLGNYVGVEYWGNIETPPTTFWTYDGGTDIINDTSTLFSGAMHFSIAGINPLPTFPNDTTSPNVSVELIQKSGNVGTPSYYQTTKGFANSVNVTNGVMVNGRINAGVTNPTFPLVLNSDGNLFDFQGAGSMGLWRFESDNSHWWKWGAAGFNQNKGVANQRDFQWSTDAHYGAGIADVTFHTNGTMEVYSNIISGGVFVGSMSIMTNQIISVNADYTLTATNNVLILGANHSVTLPNAAALPGKEYWIMCGGVGTNAIVPCCSQTLTGPGVGTGATKWTNTAVGTSTKIISDGVSIWYVLKN